MPREIYLDAGAVLAVAPPMLPALPAAVDEEKVKASLRDGVLELTLPKVEKAKRRTIRVD